MVMLFHLKATWLLAAAYVGSFHSLPGNLVCRFPTLDADTGNCAGVVER